MKRLMIHNYANIRHGSVRTLTSTVENKNLKIWLDYAVEAYNQVEKMSRYIALKSAPEFNMEPDVLLQLLRYLLRVSESGDT